MRIYLSGPMRGIPGWNYRAFLEGKGRLEALGHHVLCPATISRAMGYTEDSSDGNDREHLLHVIQSDMACLYSAEAIALLPGWEKSVGATVELAMAQFLSLKVMDAETGEEVYITAKPWGALDESIHQKGW